MLLLDLQPDESQLFPQRGLHCREEATKGRAVFFLGVFGCFFSGVFGCFLVFVGCFLVFVAHRWTRIWYCIWYSWKKERRQAVKKAQEVSIRVLQCVGSGDDLISKPYTKKDRPLDFVPLCTIVGAVHIWKTWGIQVFLQKPVGLPVVKRFCEGVQPISCGIWLTFAKVASWRILPTRRNRRRFCWNQLGVTFSQIWSSQTLLKSSFQHS